MRNPHGVTKDLEGALCEYTGAKHAVVVNSCTMALLLAVRWNIEKSGAMGVPYIEIPKRTYCSVPMSIIHAGGHPVFREQNWLGMYRLDPLPVWDSARYLSKDMYLPSQFMCLSFHSTKILGDTQGGAIIHDNDEADVWFRRARFDGRAEGVPPKDDTFTLGYHCYISPDVSTRLLWKLQTLPEHNPPLPNDPYPDLSLQEIFQ